MILPTAAGQTLALKTAPLRPDDAIAQDADLLDLELDNVVWRELAPGFVRRARSLVSERRP
jgi:hypothetical protein